MSEELLSNDSAISPCLLLCCNCFHFSNKLYSGESNRDHSKTKKSAKKSLKTKINLEEKRKKFASHRLPKKKPRETLAAFYGIELTKKNKIQIGTSSLIDQKIFGLHWDCHFYETHTLY